MDISKEKLNELFIKASKQVFVDMLEEDISVKNVLFVTPDEKAEAEPNNYGLNGNIRGTLIDFTGDFKGEIYLYYNYDGASAVTRKFFEKNEIEIDEVDDSINDIIGEIANMLAGLFKGCLLRTKMKCLLGLPSMLEDKYVPLDKFDSYTFRNQTVFTLMDQPVIAELVFYK